MRRWLFVSTLALAACQTQTMERDAMGLWKQGDSGRASAAPPQEAPKEETRGTVVTIPADVVQAQAAFVDKPSTLFADAVEVDMSRDGWFALVSIAISPDAVVRRDEQDNASGVNTITLQRIPQVAVTKDSIPTVRFGGGMCIAAVERVVLRFWKKQSADRPQWFHAAGTGQVAVYSVESEPPKEWRGRRVDVRAEIQKAGGSYRFASNTEAQP